ncbi:MAG: response regulator [Candidatus Omnitrophica bacterium]|nr:response regulator [Candidatus Omnitrophota bacterium]
MRKKILVADDEPDIARTISIMLESEGYDVITAGDGQDAINKVYTDCPDLIILDLLLPLADGREVASTLKIDQRSRNIPIIFITAQTQKNDKEALKNSPAEFCIFKPFDLDVLKDRIENILKPA